MIVTEKKLDDKDKQIIKLAGDGKTYKEIASDMGLSKWTVVGRIQEMKRYYKCKNLPQLVFHLDQIGECK